jgi:hypothetical protein
MLKTMLEKGMVKATSVSSDTAGEDYHAGRNGLNRSRPFGGFYRNRRAA